MGIHFSIVNLDKKQYLPPWRLGDSNLTRDYLEGDHALALALLTCNAEGIGVGPPAGSWWGDRVVAVMDCAPPNEFGIPTQTEEEPDRNLYMMAWQEFEDISYDALAMLCKRSPEYADRLASQARDELERESTDYLKTRTLRRLGRALEKQPCPWLRSALERSIGTDWVETYQEARRLYREMDEEG
jgi:hypothetical protein